VTAGFRNNLGVDADNAFDPDVVGDGPAATGFRNGTGQTLKYAALHYGAQAGVQGFRIAGGADDSTLWAKAGSTSYSLPINGGDYSAEQLTRGGVSLYFNMKSDGTYSIDKTVGGTASTAASGTWLPAGDTVAQYSVAFTVAQSNQVVFFNGLNSATNDAPSPQPLTTSRKGGGASQANLVSDRATQDVAVTMTLYKSGVVKSQTHVTFHLKSNPVGA